MARVTKPRDYISPSDLTFLWGECKKCMWLKYNKGISRPGFMPLVGPMSAYQEQSYRNVSTKKIHKSLPAGEITMWGQSVESVPLVIDGIETKWRIKGKYDVVAAFKNGTHALIDCKVTTSVMEEDKVNLYWPQLEAYAFALENPLDGVGIEVSETGLLMWRVVGAATDLSKTFDFTCDKDYLSAGREPKKFQKFIAKVITMLDGDIPESGEKCTICKFVEKRESLGVFYILQTGILVAH